GKFGAPPKPPAPPRPPGAGPPAPPRPAVADAGGRRSAQFVTQTEPSGSFTIACLRPPPSGIHVPLRSGRPSGKRCAAAIVAINSKAPLNTGIFIVHLGDEAVLP